MGDCGEGTMRRWTLGLVFGLVGCSGGGMIGPDKASGDDTDADEGTEEATVEAADMVDRSFALRLDEGVVPFGASGVGFFPAVLLGGPDPQVKGTVLMAVVDAADDQLHLASAMGSISAQDYCRETLDVPDVTGFPTNGTFEIPLLGVVVEAGGWPFTLTDAVITGRFSGDGESIEAVELTAVVDYRELFVLIPDITSTAMGCELLAQFGVVCEPCPGELAEDEEAVCGPVLVNDIPADRVDDLVVETVTAEDIAGNPSCAAN
jgi:hypothetical protein